MGDTRREEGEAGQERGSCGCQQGVLHLLLLLPFIYSVYERIYLL